MMLHLVGRVTESVASFIGPGAEHLLGLGVPQTVMMLHDPALPNPLSRLPDGVEVQAIPLQPGGAGHWQALRRAYRRMAAERDDVQAVHFHGVRPWLLGQLERSTWRRPPQMYLSPHGSRLLPLLPWAMALTRERQRPDGATIIATSDFEARHVRRVGLDATTSNIAIDDPYFALPHHDAAPPRILGGSYPLSRVGAEQFAHVGVLLVNAVPDVRFEWLGPCTVGSQAKLAAAGVAHGLSPGGPDDPAVRHALSQATLFVATAPNPRLPLLLAQAMAAGLPCVALNTPTHAELIDHRRTGLLVDTEAELLTAICRLLDDRALRNRLAVAARAEARLRFARRRFAQELIPGYGAAAWLSPATEAVAKAGRGLG